MKIKLTKRVIEGLQAPDPSGKQVLYWDTGLPGFGLLVSGRTDTRAYVVQREVNGRSRRWTIGTVAEFAAGGKSMEYIRNKAADLLEGMRDGKDPRAGRSVEANITLAEVLDLYIAARPNLAERSKGGYRAIVERHLTAWLKRPLREIDANMVERRFQEISAGVAGRATKKGNGHPERTNTPGAASANAALKMFRALWNFADGRVPELPENPVTRLKRQWHQLAKRERYVSPDNLGKFYEAVDALPSRGMRDYLLLLLFTGLRRGEASTLKWADVDFTTRTINLPAKMTKAKRPLDLPMSDFVHALLVARRAIGYENEYVFPGDSKAGHLTEPKFALAEVGRACGVNVSPHDLRRTFVSVASRTSMPQMAFKGLVNHAVGGDITENYAVGFGVEDLRGPMEAIGKKLETYCGITAPADVVPFTG